MLQKTQADFNDAINSVKNNIFSNLICHNIGKILTYYPDTQTADIELMQVKEYNGVQYPNAVISQVPLIIYGTANAQITLPDMTGTICLLLTLDRNIDAFMETGTSYLPPTGRMHNITDSIAITTFSTLNNPIQDYDNEAISIIHKKIIEEIAYTSIIKNYANYILLQRTNGTNTSTIKIDDLITIQNTSQNLGTLIKSLITTIKALTITNNAVSTASKNALDTVATNFAALLKETE